jgi:hypothetical protein
MLNAFRRLFGQPKISENSEITKKSSATLLRLQTAAARTTVTFERKRAAGQSAVGVPVVEKSHP